MWCHNSAIFYCGLLNLIIYLLPSLLIGDLTLLFLLILKCHHLTKSISQIRKLLYLAKLIETFIPNLLWILTHIVCENLLSQLCLNLLGFLGCYCIFHLLNKHFVHIQLLLNESLIVAPLNSCNFYSIQIL